MTTSLHIEHPITAYETWKGAFDKFAPMRSAAGVRAHHIRRPVNDENFVVIDLDFDTAEEAEHFLQILRERVWAVRENSPALAGEPRTSILETLDAG